MGKQSLTFYLPIIILEIHIPFLLDIPSPALKMASSTTTTADAIAATPTPPNSGLTPTSKSEPDVEKQDSFEKNGPNNLSTEVLEDAEPGLEDNSKVPRMSLSALFWFFFYNFGLFAWGGPVAHIALILPGFILMLLASYLYSLAGFENVYFNASFRALQPIVAAMILKAVHKIADHSVINTNTKKVDVFLVIAAICTAINGALRINIFISLGFYGIWYSLTARRLWIPAAVLWILQYVGFALFVVFRGFPSPVALALGIAQTPSLINLFVLGLVAGSLSFGGAYTAIPFIQVEAVLKGGWLPQSVFIDCI